MKRVREHRDALVRRLPALQIAVAAAFVAVVGSYWFVQVVQGDYYRVLAENNRLKEIPVEAGSLRVITLWHVLEHTTLPGETLAAARRLLAGDGIHPKTQEFVT